MRISKGVLKPVVIVALAIMFIAAIRYLGFDARLLQLKQWILSLGFWGPFVFAIVYTVSVTALVPGSAMTIAAGALFGTLKGVITVSFASTLGAAFSFIISRHLARGTVERWLGKTRNSNNLMILPKNRER